jgi:hypothetical protein
MNTPNTKPDHAPVSAAEHIKVVKAAWDKAPAGAKKDAAHTYYAAAEQALKANDETAAMKALGDAEKALH